MISGNVRVIGSSFQLHQTHFVEGEVEKQVTKLPIHGASGKVVLKRGKGRKRWEEGRKGNMLTFDLSVVKLLV